MYMRNRDLVIDAIRKRLRTDLEVPKALNKDLVVVLEKLKAAELAAQTPQEPPNAGNPEPSGG